MVLKSDVLLRGSAGLCAMFLALSAGLLPAGATAPGRGRAADGAASGGFREIPYPVSDTVSVRELPLPQVPATLRDPVSRANYLVGHFWDAMDFRDSLLTRDRRFLEQNFVNYLSVFPLADEGARRGAAELLFRRAEDDAAACRMLADIAEKYLYDPDSPMYSEDQYILFLEQIVPSAALGEAGTLRYRWQLEAARANRPGSPAADFAFVTRDGRSMTLHEFPVSGELLLIFYDPDCGHCREVMTRLEEDPRLNRRIADGHTTVLAVCSGSDPDLWNDTASLLPAGWTVGYESGELQETGAYVFRTFPTLFLLDADKRVLQKNLRPDDYLGQPTEHVLHFM